MTNIVILAATITAYTWSGQPCADGQWPAPGMIAAPRWVPFGSVVAINGHRYTVTDRLHPRFPDRWDIYLPTARACRRHGIQTNTVQILAIGSNR